LIAIEELEATVEAGRGGNGEEDLKGGDNNKGNKIKKMGRLKIRKLCEDKFAFCLVNIISCYELI